MTKIFIDDERYPITDDFVICRTLRDFTSWVEDTKRLPNFISFDHDLGENEPTGYDIAKWIVEYDMDHSVLPDDFSFYVHSQNPIGRANIESILQNYLRVRNC